MSYDNFYILGFLFTNSGNSNYYIVNCIVKYIPVQLIMPHNFNLHATNVQS